MTGRSSFCFRLGLGAVLLAGCKPSYPKENLLQSVQSLFRKELGVEVRTELVGKTLYVSFPIENIVTTNFDLPKDVTEKLENAMLSISRIGLSTDADVRFTVIQARDPTWGVETLLIRRMQDLKDLFYWKVSKQDFDERIVLEAHRVERGDPPESQWKDLTLEDYLCRWVACRINLGARANPFLNLLLGFDKISGTYSPTDRSLRFTVEQRGTSARTSSATFTSELLENYLLDQIGLGEKKYLAGLAEGRAWAEKMVVLNPKGEVLLERPAAAWRDQPPGKKTARRRLGLN